jgi:hypothetical protein
MRTILRVVWALALGGVAVASLAPSSSLPSTPQALGDKVLHFLAYSTLAALPAVHEAAGVVAFVQIGLLAFGLSLECAQQMTVDRTFEWADMLANSLGVAAGCLAGLAIRRLR